MPFSPQEGETLLAVKGVGETVIKRFEEISIDSFEQLKNSNHTEIAESIAQMLQTTCWQNSPQAKAAITAAIQRAKLGL